MNLDLGPGSPFGLSLGPNWRGKKVLGRGSFGVVGLWEWTPTSILPSSKPPPITQVAIKQIHTTASCLSDNLLESMILGKLVVCKSRHIVRQYRPAQQRKLSDGSFLVGMFLEFCPGGDLMVLMDGEEKGGRGKEEGGYVAEVDLWMMFDCLAFAVAVMARGTEDVKSPPILHGVGPKGLVHYDIKLDNILLGNRDPDHIRYPILKIGDFGSAKLELKAAPRAVQIGLRDNGAAGWRAPENAGQGKDMKTPLKGACSNIFQIGLIMHALLRREVRYPATTQKQLWRAPFRKSKQQGKFTHGADLFGAKWRGLYSQGLRDLVMECLMWEPSDRPDVVELQKGVKAGLAAAMKLDGSVGGEKAGKTVVDFDKVPVVGVEWPVGP